MTRRCALTFAGLLALVAPVTAQMPMNSVDTGPQLPYSRFAITPFIGARAPLNTGRTIVVFDSTDFVEARYERGAAPMIGVEGELRVSGPWSLVGAAAASPRGNDVLRTVGAGNDSLFSSSVGTSVLFARLGASYRIPDPQPDERRFHPGGFVSVSPALVRMKRPNNETVNNFAANIGLAATGLVGRSRRLALQVGLEDYLTFLNTDRLSELDAVDFSRSGRTPVVDYRYSSSNILAIRFGASFRM